MSAAYDKFDYLEYWEGREYEHESEVVAVKQFLDEIPIIKNIVDVGGGYGRLTPYYYHRTGQIYLVDSSKKLLAIAKKTLLGTNNIKFVHSKIEKYIKKTRKKFDLVMCVRVAHHINDLDSLFSGFNKILNDDGYLIFEFPNKRHFKALLQNVFNKELLQIINVFPEDRRCSKNRSNNSIAFNNYHPDYVIELLKQNNFEIKQVRSVSNIRCQKIKNFMSLESMMWIEKKFQLIGTRFFWGPSIFILAKKHN